MKKFRKKLYAAGGFTTTFMGSGRKEFDPSKPQRTFDSYLKETAEGTLSTGIDPNLIDIGVIGSFMSPRFINQANLPGFLPMMIPSLRYRPCYAVEGACGTGGRAIGVGALALLADQAEIAFISAFEIQNCVKAVYGADILAGAGYYAKERKHGHSFFFPGVFSDRAGAYYQKYGFERARKGMAKWYEQSVLNARKNPKAQEYHNAIQDLFEKGQLPPDPKKFVPHLTGTDCSRVSDGAASILLLTEEGLRKGNFKKEDVIEIVAIAEVQEDISLLPEDLTVLSTTERAVKEAFETAGISKEDLGWLEIHDCFSITAVLAIEAIGFASRGEGLILSSKGGQVPQGSFRQTYPVGFVALGIRQVLPAFGC